MGGRAGLTMEALAGMGCARPLRAPAVQTGRPPVRQTVDSRLLTPPPPSTGVRRLLPSQVRRLVGLLVRIGLGEEEEPEVVRAALDEPGTFDRRRAPTAPAEGLWLECVELG